jgi:ligand-binding sensor domain-containing protein/signal transduction histidine kinase
MWRVCAAMLMFWLGGTGRIHAQAAPQPPVDYWVESWGTMEGLPQNSVTAIIQSRQGYLWLGTQRGLVRYDGFTFRVFDSENTPALRDDHDHVTCLVEDPEGALWIGTERGGVLKHQDGTFTPFNRANGPSDFAIAALCVDSFGSIWAGGESGGLFQHRAGEFTAYSFLQDLGGHRARVLLPGPRGRLWLATGSQFGWLEDGQVRFLGETPARAPDAVGIGRATGGGVWVALNGRLRKYDDTGHLEGDGGAFAPENAPPRVTLVYEDRKGAVWIGTAGQGVHRFAEGRFTPLRFTSARENRLEQQTLLAVIEDREGNIWMGTREGGLHRLKPRLFDVLDQARGLGANEALAVCEGRDGTIWAGSKGGGLRRLREGRLEPFFLPGPGAETVWALHSDTRTNLWAGTEGGLFRITGGVATNYGPATASMSIRALYEDRRGVLWIGTKDAGICRMDAAGIRSYSEREGLANNEVRAFQEDAQGALWIATAHGLSRLSDGKFQTFRARDGLPSDNIRVLYWDAFKGALWAGTGRGLACLIEGRWVNFTTREHRLPDDYIAQILDDDRGNLWIGSNKGVYRLKKSDAYRVMEQPGVKLSWVPYGTSDGLKSLECSGDFQPSALKSADGRIWFPTTDGLAVVDLISVRQNDRPPGVIIESLSVDGHPFSLAPPVKVPPGGGRFEFGYTGFNFSAPRRLGFQYQLEGRDKDWIDGGPGHRAIYNDLPPGSYTFRVKAYNLDGVNEIGTALEFAVLPPFWRTGWFLSLAVLLSVALAVSAYRYLALLQLKRRLRELERQQALERERARIAKDVHDDLGARLTQIGIIGELIRRDAAQPQIAGLAGRLTEATREVSEAVDEIVWAVNPKNDTLDRLVPYLLHYAEEFLEPTDIRYRLDAPKDFPPLPIKSDARHNLFLVLKEALNNSVKHARAGEIHVQIAYARPEFTVEVTDNGAGFDPAALDARGNGLQNMRRRIEEIGGRFMLDSRPGQGTRLRISLALK